MKDLGNPQFASSSVTLNDAFAVNDGSFTLRKPFLFCTPVSKDGQPIANPDAHLTCYKSAGAGISSSARPQIEIGNTLGTLQLEVKRAQLYCERSTKTPLP